MFKLLKYFPALIIFSLAFLILLNYYRISNDEELNISQKYFKHFVKDHGFNDVSFGFIKINFGNRIYLEKGSSEEMNVAAASCLFLISSYIILCSPTRRKSFFAEKFLFTAGFKDSPYKPPKYTL
ncbi:MAG TPA: hypothetical protein PKC91_10730 [Ignavibacteria bacterium]|nr:hypothetical protein [Ignavibacteria bacterium]